MLDMISSNKEITVKKHVNAIHCTNPLTIVDRKIANVLLYNAYNDLMKKDVFTIPVKDLCELVGYNSRNYARLIESLRRLATTAIEWGVLSTSKELKKIDWEICPFLSYARIKNSMCVYEYSKHMKEKLNYPEIYGVIDINKQALFKTSFGLALYETCCRFKNISQTKWIDVSQFKKILGVTEEAYPRYYDFKKKLKIALGEVNKLSGFVVDIQEKKIKRVVTHIRILISHPKEGVLIKKDEVDQNQNPAVIHELVNTFGVNEKVAIKLFSDFGADYISDKISIVKANISSNPSKKVANLAGLIVSAISNNYEKAKTSKEIADEIRNKKLEQEAEKEAEQILAQKEQVELNKKYQLYRSNLISGYLVTVQDEELDELYDEFREYCRKTNHVIALKNFIKDKDLDNPITKGAFDLFIINEKLQGRVMSRDEFVRVG